MDKTINRRQSWLICLGLALAVLAAYGQLWDCDFVALDDGDYVTSNRMVRQGLSGPGMVWALTTFRASNWHPLTWISHMADCQLYGTNAAGHHFTSLFLHLANSILLFLLLRRLTRAQWPAALAAALFALHPLHVESVAWISERKDVLSTLFWMLTIWAYVRYVEEFKTNGSRSKVFFAASLTLFALGLMAKPMLVTIPFVLLLLDYWPLQRLRPPLGRLLAEKIPFLILATASSLVTFVAQRQGGAVVSMAGMPLVSRLANVPVAYARYLGKTFWPVDLAVYYPIQRHWPAWAVAASCLLLALISVWVICRLRSQPYLAVGWFWFLGTLVPVIGLVQTGWQSMADRYDYVPGIGLSIMVIWVARDWIPRRAAPAAAVLACLALAACLALTRMQTAYWTNNVTLFRHAVESTEGNGVMESSLGRALFLDGRQEEAMQHLRRGVALNPGNPGGYYNLGNALMALGRVPQAVEQFEIAVSLAPRDAINQFTLGAALLQNGRAGDAIRHLETALQIFPNDADSHFKLGAAFMQTGRAKAGVDEFEKTQQIQPDHVLAGACLAWILATNPDASLRDGARAVTLAIRADRLSGGQNPAIVATLAAAYAEAGKYSEAVATAQRALQLPAQESNSPLVAALQAQIALYRANAPFHDTTPAGLPSALMDP